MDPRNYNNIPQGQPTPQNYGAGAEARAMAVANPVAQPLSMPAAQPYPATQTAPSPSTYPTAQPTPTTPMPATISQTSTPAAPFSPQSIQPLPGAVQPTQAVAATPEQNLPEPPKVVENPISTQATLLFSELRDSIIIMKDGSFRAVVACQSINFDLMSEQEREGVEYSYQNFLNSLNFTVQILVRSQRVDIGPYIDRLSQLRRNNDNMLLGVLMDDYINFISQLSQAANIMDKSFFVVIPYYASADLERAVEETKNFLKVMGKNKNPGVTRINRDIYNKAIDELNNRVESVISGLYNIGIKSVRLNTRELSQLFYNFNNPDTAVREPLVDFSKLANLYVKKGTKGENNG